MYEYQHKPADAMRRRQFALALSLTILFTAFFLTSGQACAFESVAIDQPSSAINAGETLPLLSGPIPVPANDDSCLPLLKSVRYTTPVSSATDRDRHLAGKAAAIGLVFGVRFALGPKEIARTKESDKAVRFDIWQPRDGGAQALAVADYRRCKNDQALKAISDWRWKR